MTALPRILTIMGSGETTPTMARVHRAVLDRLGERPVPAVVLDTPYGFQENAEDITERAVDYFRATVGAPFAIASFRSADADAAHPRDGAGPDPRRAAGLHRTGQPLLRAAAMGGLGDPEPAGRRSSRRAGP